MNRLYKSNKDKVFEGVCGGLGEYFNIDPVIIRLVWVVLIIFGGTGVVAYLIAMFIIPKRPDSGAAEALKISPAANESYSSRFWGTLLISAGILLMISFIGPVTGIFAGAAFLMTSILWPVLVIGLGIYLFFKQTAGSESQNFTSEIFPQGKSFYKSKTDKRIAGVCGGIGAYFGIDSNIIRVLWTVATLGSFGFGVLGYLVLAVVLSESD